MKYKDEIEVLPTCPPSNAAETDAVIYRLVHDPLQPRNFLPQALNNPKRMKTLDDKAKCSNWAISCYDSFDNAQHHLNGMPEHVQKFLGTNIAEINVCKSDGKLTPPEPNGHMNLFESKLSDLESKVKVFAS